MKWDWRTALVVAAGLLQCHAQCADGGISVAGADDDACWYVTEAGVNCGDTCDALGQAWHFDNRDFSGSSGSKSNCQSTREALGMSGGVLEASCPSGFGCWYSSQYNYWCKKPRTQWNTPPKSGSVLATLTCACRTLDSLTLPGPATDVQVALDLNSLTAEITFTKGSHGGDVLLSNEAVMLPGVHSSSESGITCSTVGNWDAAAKITCSGLEEAQGSYYVSVTATNRAGVATTGYILVYWVDPTQPATALETASPTVSATASATAAGTSSETTAATVVETAAPTAVYTHPETLVETVTQTATPTEVFTASETDGETMAFTASETDEPCNPLPRLNCARDNIATYFQINSSDSCCDMCRDNPECRFWSWNSRHKSCSLKHSCSAPYSSSRHTSGYMAHRVQQCAVQEGKSCRGGNIRVPVSVDSSEECCALCSGNGACEFWTWTDRLGGWCSLKSGCDRQVDSSASVSGSLVHVD